MNKMAIFCLITLIVLAALLSTACSHIANFQAEISSIPSGYIECDEHWDKEGIQDYTDYCKYIYDSDEKVIELPGYMEVTEKDIENIDGYFDNFQEWMTAEDRLSEYDFDENCVSAGDYFRIIEKGNLYADYTIYFFDKETLTLYYFHNNT